MFFKKRIRSMFYVMVFFVFSCGSPPNDPGFTDPDNAIQDSGGTGLDVTGRDTGEIHAMDIPENDAGHGTIQARLYKSGSRIKAKVVFTPGGAQSFAGWYDTKLDVDCRFRTASDGKNRCLPVLSLYVNSYYGDLTCSQKPLALLSDANYVGAYNGKVPKWIVWSQGNVDDNGCALSATTRYFHTGPEYTGDVYTGTSGACHKIKSGLNCYRFFTLGKEVPLTTFQEAREKVLN